MLQGKQSIHQLVGTMMITTSLALGGVVVPAINAVNAHADTPVADNVAGQIIGDFQSGDTVKGITSPQDLSDGRWIFNNFKRTVTVKITDKDGNEKKWVSPGDTIEWSVTYSLEANPTSTVSKIAVEVAGSKALDYSNVTVKSNIAGKEGSITLDSAPDFSTDGAPFDASGVRKINGNSDANAFTKFGQVNSVKWVPISALNSEATQMLAGDSVTITATQTATEDVVENDTALAPSDYQIDTNASLYTDLIQAFKPEVAENAPANDGNNRATDWNRTNWPAFKDAEPILMVARSTVSFTNNLDVPVTYVVGDKSYTVQPGQSSSVIGAPYGTYEAQVETNGVKLSSKRSITLDNNSASGTAQLVLTKDQDFPALNYADQIKQIGELKNLTDEQKSAYIASLNDASNADAANAIVTGASAVNDNMGGTNTDADATAQDKAAAQAAIKALGFDENSPQYLAVTNATKAKDVADALLAAQKENFAKQINNLQNLTAKQKETYNKSLTAATNSVAALAVLNGAKTVDGAMGQADPTTVTDKAVPADVEAAKDAIEALDLGTDGQKYLDAINAKDVSAGVVAKAVKDAQEAAADAQKAAAKNRIDGFENLTAEQKNFYKEAIDKADGKDASAIADAADKVNGAMGNENPESVTDKAVQSDIDAAKAAINALNLGADGQKYLDAVAADGVSAGTVAKNVNDAIAAAKKAATDKVDGLQNLTEEQKNSYKEAITKGTGAEAADIADAADKVNGAMGSEDPESVTDKAVKADVEAAKAAIDALNLGTDGQKYLDAINAKDVSAGTVAKAVLDAKKDAADVAKRAAKSRIDALNNLTAEQKNSYKEAIDKADSKDASDIADAADKVNGAMGNENPESVTDKAVQSDIDAAKAAIEALNLGADGQKYLDAVAADGVSAGTVAKNVNDAIAAAKKAATDKVDALNNLTPEQKQSYKDAIASGAGTEAAGIADAATKVDGAMGNEDPESVTDKAVQSDIDAAKAAIEALNLGADGQKYLDAINATDVSAGAVAKAVKDALADGLNKANAAIDAMKNLTADEKTAAKNNIATAKGGTAIASLLKASSDTNQKRFDDALDTAKKVLAAAKAERDSIRYTNGSDARKAALDEQIAKLEGLIASATDVNAFSAAELTAAAQDTSTAQEELDGTEKTAINWKLIAGIGGGVLALGAIVAVVMTAAQQAPAAAPAPAPAAAPAPGADAQSGAAQGAAQDAAQGAGQGAPAADPAAQNAAAAAQNAAAVSRATGRLAVTGTQAGLMGLVGMVLVALGGVFAFRRKKEN